MAECIPDRLPARASAGEQKTFSVLQALPDDCIVYYEPIVEDRYPDFVIICPELGLLVIEVKGWYPRDIVAADSQVVVVKEHGEQVRRNHPIRQARDYMFCLMNKCRESSRVDQLLQKSGDFQNRFLFPFGHLAILSNITSEQLKEHHLGDLTPVFSSKKVIPRNILQDWCSNVESGALSAENLYATFRSYFDPFWEFPRLTELQINTLRAIIHPDIIRIPDLFQKDEKISPQNQTEEQSLKVLDLRQENNARSIGQGHRIIYGVAGSGKTVLLIARARFISYQNAQSLVLILCYNRTFAAYLRGIVSDCPNVNVYHFDGWSKANGVVRRNEESDEALGKRLLNLLEQEKGDFRKYDAVMVDEAQDFETSWFQCVLEAMKEPNDGDLIIVGDGGQGLYPRGKVSWKKIGINARGRTISAKFDLDKNYRNTREIMELAEYFSTQEMDEEEDSIQSLKVDPSKCVRQGGFKPVMVLSRNKNEESSRVLRIIKDLLDGNWFGKKITPLAPAQIGILYPLVTRHNRNILTRFIENLGEATQEPVVWLNDSNDREARDRVTQPGIKIQTIHSAKGLQYRAVILLWADELPSHFENTDEQAERRLFYVGLTRAEDFLVISGSEKAKFISEIEASNKVDFA